MMHMTRHFMHWNKCTPTSKQCDLGSLILYVFCNITINAVVESKELAYEIRTIQQVRYTIRDVTIFWKRDLHLIHLRESNLFHLFTFGHSIALCSAFKSSLLSWSIFPTEGKFKTVKKYNKCSIDSIVYNFIIRIQWIVIKGNGSLLMLMMI